MDSNGVQFSSDGGGGYYENQSSFDNDSFADGERQLYVTETTAASPMDKQINMINIIWTISFTVIVVVGTCGNGIVLWIILGK